MWQILAEIIFLKKYLVINRIIINMDVKNNNLINLFDLENLSKEEQEDFMQDIGELVMQTVIRKAWKELDSVKRNNLTELLEESDNDSDSSKKYEAVFAFLDENVVDIRKYVVKETEKIQKIYRESRDELRDSIT